MTLLREESPNEGNEQPETMSGEPAELVREFADLVPEENHRFGKREVRVYPDRVALFDEHGAQLLSVPMAEIRSARTEPLVGGARLELETVDGIVPVAECSAAVAARFSELARGIEQLAKGEPLNIKLKAERTHCEKCGLPLPEKDGRCAACVKRMAVMGRVLSYLKPYRKQSATLILTQLVFTASSLTVPLITKVMADRVFTNTSASPGSRFGLLVLLVLGIAASLGLGAMMEVVKGWNIAFLSGNIARDLRSDVYQALERLHLTFYDKKQVGAITSRVTQDTDRIWGLLVDGVPFLVTSTLMIVGTAALGMFLNWRLTLAVLAPVPVVSAAAIVFWRPMSAMFYKVGQKWGRLHTQLNESITGIRMVKAFAQEGGEYAKFQKRNEELADSGIRVDRRWYTFSGVMAFFTGWGSLINWTYGGWMVLHGQMSFGTLLAAQQLLFQVYGPLQWFAQVNQWFSRAMAGAERIFEVVDAQPEAYDAADAVRIPQMEGHVHFQNVRFGYDKSNPVLKGIDLDVKAGEMIGLVGKSGAGKSTTVNLLCRFYEADAGTLQVDGTDIRDLSLTDLRKHIGIVPQDPFLFNGTIAENIAYGKPGASRDEVMTAARAACAHSFIVAKPDGYDTQVGEKGGKLSGGERQRVAIARAILHDPKILILDEATSSVDVETEKKIQVAIGNLVRGRTTFAIAHRLSTLRNADRLVVLEKGQIVEIGTHAELMAKEGEFYKLVQTPQQTSAAIALVA
jgi:ATP-binding cassette subfamily B protein